MSSASESSYGQSRKRDKPSEAFPPKLYPGTSRSNRGSHPLPPLSPRPRPGSFSGFNKDDDLNLHQDTDNVTGRRTWRQEDPSVKSSPRPRFSRQQPRSGIETFSPPEAPNLQQGTVYSSRGRQLSEEILNNTAQLTVTPNSRIGSEPLSHSRESYHLGGLAHEATTRSSTHLNTEQVQQYSSDAVNNNSARSQKGAFHPLYKEPGLPLPKVTDGQKQATSSKSWLSDLDASGLRGSLDSQESSQSPHPDRTPKKSSSQRKLIKSNHPWSYSLPGDWTPSKSKMKIPNGDILGNTLKRKGYVRATTSKGLVRKIKPENNRNILRDQDGRKSNYRGDYREKHDSRSSEQLDDEYVEGMSSPSPPHQFDTRSLRSTR
ncbi:hypothetical protein BOTCAL_0132g00130 [Botryotinia calthae]|uniref:Uncharacterized protein n=1 Tax=Botryotinia calthae TaxID=38488 RepID=A0A4Y8D620_9HELO|nr:hypothetical protein BOTCAL_0132g00130 [Botryotinia calthae]